MINIPTLYEFIQRTAPLVDFEFEDVDIVPDTITGGFESNRLTELESFCKKNPDYHIISIIDGCLYFNKVAPYATKYLLGEGDSNSELVCFEGQKFREILYKYPGKDRRRA